MSVILELKNVSREFGLPSGAGSLTVLKDVSLKVEQGGSVAVVGPSGSGKSTLLNIMGALDRPTSGQVLFDGEDYSNREEDDLARIRNQEIGFIFQLHHLLPQCTALENVLIPTIPSNPRGNAPELRMRAEGLLERVGLGGRRDHFPAQLSGGELQRVAAVRALINRPKIVLADEPTGSLDKASTTELGGILTRMNREEETTLIVVTHSMELAGLMDRIYLLEDGRLTEYDHEET